MRITAGLVVAVTVSFAGAAIASQRIYIPVEPEAKTRIAFLQEHQRHTGGTATKATKDGKPPPGVTGTDLIAITHVCMGDGQELMFMVDDARTPVWFITQARDRVMRYAEYQAHRRTHPGPIGVVVGPATAAEALKRSHMKGCQLGC